MDAYAVDLQITKIELLFLLGLELELYIEEHEYISDIQESSGIRVTIHEQNKMPFPEDEGLSVQPGALTSVGIRKVCMIS